MSRKTEVITFRTSPEAKEAIQKLASDSYMSLSGFMSELIDKLLENKEVKEVKE